MKTTILLFSVTFTALLAAVFVGGMLSECWEEHELRNEAQQLDELLQGRRDFQQSFAEAVDAWRSGEIELPEASQRILERSRREFPRYIELLRVIEGQAGKGLTDEELVARNILVRMEDIVSTPK